MADFNATTPNQDGPVADTRLAALNDRIIGLRYGFQGSGITGAAVLSSFVGGAQIFDLQLEMSADKGVTWTTIQKVASSASGDATYPQSASLSGYPPSWHRVSVKSSFAGANNILYDSRLFNLNQR